MDSSSDSDYNINYQYLESNKPACRICFETETSDKDKLISPCKCIGSSKYIHTQCLNQWRSSNNYSSEARTICMECKYAYKIKTLRKPEPLFIKMPILFNKHIISSVISIFILVNLLAVAFSQLDGSVTLGRVALYSVEGEYSYYLIIPDFIIVLFITIYYLRLIPKLAFNENIRPTSWVVIETAIYGFPIIYLFPSIGFLLYMLYVHRLYKTFFKTALLHYSLVEESILEYNPNEHEVTSEIIESTDNEDIETLENIEICENIESEHNEREELETKEIPEVQISFNNRAYENNPCLENNNNEGTNTELYDLQTSNTIVNL